MLLETDELAQSRVSTWECSKFNKAIQAGGKEFFRFFYFKDALASLCVIFSKLRKMSLYTLDIARSDHRVMPEGFVFIYCRHFCSNRTASAVDASAEL